MSRVLTILVGVLLAAVLAGCGSSKSSGPLATELSYLPRGSLLVAAVPTDPQGAGVHFLNAIAGGSTAGFSVGLLLSELGLDYQSDIEPLFGNPILIDVSGTSLRSAASSVLAVWIPRSAVALSAVLSRLSRLAPGRSAGGATVYRLGKVTLAVSGRTLVLASSPASVQAALARHASGHGMTASPFSNVGARDTLAQVRGSLAGVIHGAALRVPWIKAITGFSGTLSGHQSSLSAQFRLDTSGASLSAGELPLAPGASPPALAGTLPVAFGLRDAARTVPFLLAAVQSTAPAVYARFARDEAAVRRRTGYDLSTFAALLTGNLILETDGHRTLARADVSDPASAARQFAVVPAVYRALFPTARGVTRQAGGFLAITSAHGRPVELGLVGRELVVGDATQAQLRAFAHAPTTPAANATGPLAVRISVLGLARLGTNRQELAVATPFLTLLGDLTGSAANTPAALTGNLGLAVR